MEVKRPSRERVELSLLRMQSGKQRAVDPEVREKKEKELPTKKSHIFAWVNEIKRAEGGTISGRDEKKVDSYF